MELWVLPYQRGAQAWLRTPSKSHGLLSNGAIAVGDGCAVQS